MRPQADPTVRGRGRRVRFRRKPLWGRAMASTSPEVISIKRYPNRRLYDRQARRYITLQDLEDLVLQGKKIEVRDSRSGEDLTRSILTQILLERHPEKMEMFPVAMLHGILQANDLVLEVFRSYLWQSLAILEQMQTPATPLTSFLAPVDWLRAMLPPALPFAAHQTTGPPPSALQPADLDARISEIEERIRRLEEPAGALRPSSPAATTGHESHPHPHAHSLAEESATLDRLEERLSELEGESESESSQGTDGTA